MPVDCFTFYKVFWVLLFRFNAISAGISYSGTFAETVSPEHQLHWIFENCKIVRATNGLSSIVEALKIANHKHDLLWYISCIPFSPHITLKRSFSVVTYP